MRPILALLALVLAGCHTIERLPAKPNPALTRDCDLFLAIGSSLVVWPAAGLPLLVKQTGARLAILNREPTEFDALADLVIRDDIGSIMEPFILV